MRRAQKRCPFSSIPIIRLIVRAPTNPHKKKGVASVRPSSGNSRIDRCCHDEPRAVTGSERKSEKEKTILMCAGSREVDNQMFKSNQY
jgi:hypothetical protein